MLGRWDQYRNLIVYGAARQISERYKITEATRRIELGSEDVRLFIGTWVYYMTGLNDEVNAPSDFFLRICANVYYKSLDDWDVYAAAALTDDKMNLSVFLSCLHDKLRPPK